MTPRSQNSRPLFSDKGSSNGDDFTVSSQTAALFKKPIEYTAQTGNACDEKLAELIQLFKIRMPISKVEDGKYLIGTRVVNVSLNNMDSLMIKVGGGHRSFQQYIKCEEAELRRLQMKIEQTGLTRD